MQLPSIESAATSPWAWGSQHCLRWSLLQQHRAEAVLPHNLHAGCPERAILPRGSPSPLREAEVLRAARTLGCCDEHTRDGKRPLNVPFGSMLNTCILFFSW